MKTNMLMKSGIGLLLLAGVGIANVAAGQGEGDAYDNLRIFHDSQSTAGTPVRGAAGPIRENMDVQPAANDIYESLTKFHEAQKLDMRSSERGAQGPIRSEADMAMERNEKEWRRMVGIFNGSD